VLLGWSPGDDREIFSRQELIEAFSLNGITRSNSIFNYRKDDPKFFTDPKALNINAHYLRSLPLAEIAPLVQKELEKAGLWDAAYTGEQQAWFLRTLELVRERFHTLTDFATLGRAYFTDDFPIDEQALTKNVLNHPELKELLPELADQFEALPQLTAAEAERVARGFAEAKGVKPGLPINAARTLITGQIKGPSMFELFEHLGKERVVKRLRTVAQYLN